MTTEVMRGGKAAIGSPLLGQSFLIVLANLVQAANPFLSLFLISRLHGLETGGQYALAQAICTPVFQFLGLQLKPLLLTHRPEELPLWLGERVRASMTFLSLLAAGGLFWKFGPFALVLAMGRLVESWAELYQANWQRRGEAGRVLVGSALRTFSVGILLVGMADPIQALAMQLLVSLTILLAWERRQDPEVEGTSMPMQALFRRGAILGVVLFLQAMQASIPRLTLEHEVNAEALGLFAALSIVLQAGTLVSSAYGQSLLGQLPEASIRQIAIWVGAPGLGAILVLLPIYAASPWIVELLLGVGNPAAVGLLWNLALAQILVWPAAVVGCALTAKRLYRPQVWITCALNGVALGAAQCLIPRQGVGGAPAVLALSAGAMLALSFATLWAKRNEGARESAGRGEVAA